MMCYAFALFNCGFIIPLVTLGLLQKRYCFEHGWGGSDVFWRACFSDLPRLWAGTPLASRGFPYSGTQPGIDQPVGTGIVLWVVSWFVPQGPTSQQAFTAAWAFVATACVVAIVVLVAARLIKNNAARGDYEAHSALNPLDPELAEVFRELSTLVIDQGTILDSVEYNIENTVVNVKEAERELGVATT